MAFMCKLQLSRLSVKYQWSDLKQAKNSKTTSKDIMIAKTVDFRNFLFQNNFILNYDWNNNKWC